MKVRVEVKQDHLERLVNKRSALDALAELIWNALDGDANNVHVTFAEDELHGIKEIHVSDDGQGITFERAKSTFKSLGDSWKRTKTFSETGRRLHGRAGEGRFAAFALGKKAKWITRSLEVKQTRRIEITGWKLDLGSFDITDPVDDPASKHGTEVIVSEIENDLLSLRAEGAPERLAEDFALYLRTYPAVRIDYDGTRLDPGQLEDLVKDYDVPEVALRDGKMVSAKLTVIEWKHDVERGLHLCDADGFTLTTLPPKIHAPGFRFTAYLRADALRKWHESGALGLGELHPDVTALLEAAKEVLRAHFRERAAEKARSVVEEWKQQKIYPFEGEARSPVEHAERQVFDVVALNVNEFLPDFADSGTKSKQFSLRMLKTAIEQSPQEARRIIQEVLDLPKEKQEELAALLERTTLTAIINASKIVADRLEFLAGLDSLIFNPETKGRVKERKHLHRILAENTWIFGEEFHLSVDDQSLNEVLRKHRQLLGDDREDLAQ